MNYQELRQAQKELCKRLIAIGYAANTEQRKEQYEILNGLKILHDLKKLAKN